MCCLCVFFFYHQNSEDSERNPQTEIAKWDVGVLGKKQSVGTSLPVATGCAEGQAHHGIKPTFNAFFHSHAWPTGGVGI